MTPPPPRFRILAQLTACAACLCLAFACGGTTETQDEPTTDAGPTNSGGNGGGGTSGSDCPSLEPAVGSGCSVDDLVCDYANCAAPDYRDAHSIACIQGAWQLADVDACDNAPLICPPSIYRGYPCSMPEGTGPCTIVDACGGLQNTYCTNGVWEYGDDGDSEDAAPIMPGSGGAGTGAVAGTVGTTSPPPVPQCPQFTPFLGAACCPLDYPAYCDYSDGSDSVITTGPGSAVTSTGSSTGGAPPPSCVACGTDMTWQYSSDCE